MVADDGDLPHQLSSLLARLVVFRNVSTFRSMTLSGDFPKTVVVEAQVVCRSSWPIWGFGTRAKPAVVVVALHASGVVVVCELQFRHLL